MKIVQVKKTKNKISEKAERKQRSLANLKPFKPGQSGNPKGKPKGTLSLTAAIKRRLQELTPDGRRQAIEMLADNIIQDALDSSDKMRQLIWNYLDGLPKASMDVTSGGKPLPILGGKTKYVIPRSNRDKENIGPDQED